jgi:MoaA/NifB/PqqE/SkfB family radical SAM enzyme
MTLSTTLTVELANRCTLSCPMCTVREKDYLKPGTMRRETFEKLADSLVKTGRKFEELRLFWLGEPLLAEDFSAILELLMRKDLVEARPFGRIGFDTNAIHMDGDKREVILALAKALPVHIICSLDAARAETYTKIRVGGDFERAVSNVESLLAERAKSSLRFPRVMTQLIVQEANKDEVVQFVDKWRASFNKNGFSFKVFYNASFAHADGVNLRPLTEQRDGSMVLQEKANLLYLEVADRIADTLTLSEEDAAKGENPR